MELEKLTAQELHAMGAEKLKELEKDIRRAILDIKMSIVQLQPAEVARKRGLRRSLARVLTVKTDTKNQGVAKA